VPGCLFEEDNGYMRARPVRSGEAGVSPAPKTISGVWAGLAEGASLEAGTASRRQNSPRHRLGEEEGHTIDERVDDELPVLLHQVVDVSENTTDRNG